MFRVVPHYSGEHSHSNYLAKSAVFKSVFDSHKRRGACPAQAELVKVQTQGKSQLGACRRLNMVKKGAEERTKTFWFRNRWLFGPRNLQSALNEMFFLPLFLVSFFFLSHVYLLGTTPVSCLAGATPVTQKERRASVVLICLHCSKEGTVYPRKTMRQLRKVCHAEGVRALFVIMATKLSKPSRRSFPCKMLVWSSSSTWQGEVSSTTVQRLCKT